MILGNITFSGNTLHDIDMAIEEAKKMIMQGNVTGKDKNEDSSFSFYADGVEDVE
jgi:hypothetical protein